MIRAILRFLALLTLLLAALYLALWQWPEGVLTPARLAWINTHYGRKLIGNELAWRDAVVTKTGTSRLHRRLELRFDEVCIAPYAFLIHRDASTCAGQIRVAVDYGLFGATGIELSMTGFHVISGPSTITGGLVARSDSGRYKGPYHYSLDARIKSHDVDNTAQASGSFALGPPFRLDGTIADQLDLRPGFIDRIRRFRFEGCEFSFLRTEPIHGHLNLDCPAVIELKPLETTAVRFVVRALGVDREIPLVVHTDLTVPYPPDLDLTLDGAIRIDAPSIPAREIVTRGGIDATASFAINELPRFRGLDAKMDMRSTIARFEAVVGKLAGTPEAVPAPFQALQGPMELRLTGSGDPWGGTIDLALDSKLVSPRATQKLDFMESARFAMDFRPPRIHARLESDTRLRDFRFSLPTWDLGAPPKLFLDHRLTARGFQETLAAQLPSRGGMDFFYRLRARTTGATPFQLVTSFTPEPVPVHFDLSATYPGEIAGTVKIDRFPVVLAGGKREVGEVDIALDTHEQRGLLTGKVQVGIPSRNLVMRLPPTQLAGQAAGQAAPTRYRPMLSLPMTRILSSLLLGMPLDEIATEPSISTQIPEVEHAPGPEFLHVRGRY